MNSCLFHNSGLTLYFCLEFTCSHSCFVLEFEVYFVYFLFAYIAYRFALHLECGVNSCFVPGFKVYFIFVVLEFAGLNSCFVQEFIVTTVTTYLCMAYFYLRLEFAHVLCYNSILSVYLHNLHLYLQV